MTNTGDVPSGVPIVTLAGANASAFSILNSSCGTALAPASADTCEVRVAFTPLVLSAMDATATLTVTDSGSGDSSAQATLDGLPLDRCGISLTGGPDLGTVVVGATGSPVSFTLENNCSEGSGTLTVATNDPTEFLFSADLCTGRDLGPYGSCTFSLQFKPAAASQGVAVARLTVYPIGIFNNPAMLTVTGTAVLPGTGGFGGGGGGSGGSTGGSGGSAGSSGGAGGSAGSSGSFGGGGGGSGGSTGGASGQGGTSENSLFTPMCSTVITLAGTSPTKNGICTEADPQSCYKTCGPESLGFKAETCTGGIYAEQTGCSFPTGVDYSCFKVPIAIDPACPTIVPQANTPCAVAECVLCNVNGGYLDSAGAAKVGYCVCLSSLAGPGKWSCAATTAWPCPGPRRPGEPIKTTLAGTRWGKVRLVLAMDFSQPCTGPRIHLAASVWHAGGRGSACRAGSPTEKDPVRAVHAPGALG